MTRAIKLNLDRTFEVFELGDYPHLREVLGAHFDIMWLNGPFRTHPNQVTVGIAVDDEGLLKDLQMNRLACSLYGVFGMTDTPIVGTAVVIAGDTFGDDVDVPDWAVELVTTIKKCTDTAMRYHQNWRMN